MKERLTTLLAWLGFLCLLFGVLPLGAMAMGYQLEAMQDKPTLQTLSCEQIEAPDSEYQQLYRSFEAAEKEVKDRLESFINNKGTKSVDHFHRRLGKVMWDKVGMSRNETGLKEAIAEIRSNALASVKEVAAETTADLIVALGGNSDKKAIAAAVKQEMKG